MDINKMIGQAAQILTEERQRPTIHYGQNQDIIYKSAKNNPDAIDAAAFFRSLSIPHVFKLREQNPRLVYEKPEHYLFSGTNFDLLISLFSRVPEARRPDFIASILRLVKQGGYTWTSRKENEFPQFMSKVSDAPLIAEFCIRTGYLRELCAATQEVKEPTVGLALMMMQLEETIALNFNVLSDDELAQLPGLLRPCREMAELQASKATGPRGGPKKPNPLYKPGREKIANRILDCIDGIKEECRQARYFYLKGALQSQKPNLEIEGDKETVIEYLDSLGFDGLLIMSLKKAEELYRAPSGTFDLKHCLSLIRTFLEHLHLQAGSAVAVLLNTTVVNEWDPVVAFLRNNDYLTKQQEKFARSLHTLLSDEGVHRLIAEQESARLLRNVVIEYGLMFLTILNKKGVKISGAPAQTTTGKQP